MADAPGRAWSGFLPERAAQPPVLHTLAAVKGVDDAGTRKPKDNAGNPTPVWRVAVLRKNSRRDHSGGEGLQPAAGSGMMNPCCSGCG